MRMKPYCGWHIKRATWQAFGSDTEPTQSLFPEFSFVVGPFRTMRGARFKAEHIHGWNLSIAQIERLASLDYALLQLAHIPVDDMTRAERLMALQKVHPREALYGISHDDMTPVERKISDYYGTKT